MGKSSGLGASALVSWGIALALVASCRANGGDPASAQPDASPEDPDGSLLDPSASGPIDKVDLLLMVDNSLYIRDKQELLSEAIPDFLTRLIDPLCEDNAGNLVAKVGGFCPGGTSEELAPITDLHLGVVSSSLGGHGGVLCDPSQGSDYPGASEQDDRGELIAPLRGLPSYDDLGFLKWDPPGQYDPPGEAVPTDFVEAARDLVLSSEENGCGYEAGLESWYRFLIDPQPPLDVTNEDMQSVPGYANPVLLDQRMWFLRPDSLVAIVMLSDENDCSVRDEGLSWLMGEIDRRIPRGTEVCLTDPNSPCCRSCALLEPSPPAGCGTLDADPNCGLGPVTSTEDSLNLRCFDQKRRFGIDFLYPIERYVAGLKTATVSGRGCASDADCPSNHPAQPRGSCVESRCEYPNPLYAPNPNYPTLVPRGDARAVYLAGIVGVPWQDIATDASLADPNELGFLRATADPNDPAAPTLADRWDVIVGDPSLAVPPTDPFMVESIDPRDALGVNPITGEAPPPVTSPAGTSPINGHEYSIPQRDDLQYACIFPLQTPRDCAASGYGCDCRSSLVMDREMDSPLCQAPGTTTAGTIQYYAKAYPGLRYLQVLKEYGANSIVGSVCPKVTDPGADSYGYGPAAEALLQRMAERLR